MKRLIGIATLVIFYSLVAGLRILPDPPFAPARYVLRFLYSKEFVGLIRYDLLSTLSLTLVAWLIGSFLGMVSGVLLAMIKKNYVFISILEFLRSVPSVMWIPFSIVIVGLGAKPGVLVGSFVVLLLMASEIAYSGYLLLESRRLHFKGLGLSLWDRIRFIHVYEVLSTAVPTSRVAITISLVVIIIVEMQAGSQSGLGAKLLVYQAGQRGEALIAVIVLAGISGLAFNAVFERIENKLMPWLKVHKDIF